MYGAMECFCGNFFHTAESLTPQWLVPNIKTVNLQSSVHLLENPVKSYSRMAVNSFFTVWHHTILEFFRVGGYFLQHVSVPVCFTSKKRK